ncbi:hypothetical protein PC116_g29223, partial [Phytophthora cactorum]
KWRIEKRISEQFQAFKEGFHELIPQDLINVFDERELELLIGGIADIDVDDWKKHTDYRGYTESDEVIQFFWQTVRSWDGEQKSRLLQFTTGTSRIPVNGFKDLQGSDGPRRFTIEKAGEVGNLPKAHTCRPSRTTPSILAHTDAITAFRRYFAQHGHSSISFTGLDIAPLVGMGLDGGWRPDKDMRWRFVQHDVRRRPWPFMDGEFDLIMVKDMSLSLSTSMRDSQSLFEEYLRVLKPGGVIEFSERDHAVRMLRPHVLRAPAASKAIDSDSDSDDSSGEEDDVEKLGAYVMTNNTPLS